MSAAEEREEVITVPVARLLRLLSEELAPRKAKAIVDALRAPRRAEKVKPTPVDYERAMESIQRKGG
jgi:hypothetical protein